VENDEHYAKLGLLLGNLHGLEFALRAFLSKRNSDSEPVVDFKRATEGDWVEINSFTNYDSLRKLVDTFNHIVEDSNPEAVIDTSVVTIRDALAHGRIAGQAASFPMTLLKFGAPKDNKVQIITEVVMDHAWFKTTVNLLYEQISKVYGASQSFGMEIMEIV